jgi:hypothetical protein
MSRLLDADDYVSINNEINNLLASAAYSGINVTLYSNSEQTILASNANGPILNRTISQITNTASYISEDGKTMPATITLNFTDGTSITEDNESPEKYWYVLSGVVFVPRGFRTA